MKKIILIYTDRKEGCSGKVQYKRFESVIGAVLFCSDNSDIIPVAVTKEL